jgi:hypothetical protein
MARPQTRRTIAGQRRSHHNQLGSLPTCQLFETDRMYFHELIDALSQASAYRLNANCPPSDVLAQVLAYLATVGV